MSKKISSDLIRGHVDTILLRTLYDGDKYGLEIIKVIGDRSGGNYQIKQPTLYSALTRLSNQGLIEAYWGESVSGGRRKYFKLTDGGRELAKQNMSEWEYSRTVIDKLISENEFDLGGKPPANVDFNLLKASVTRPAAPPQPSESESKKNLDEKVYADKLNFFKKYESERDNKNRLIGLYKNAAALPEAVSEQKEKPHPLPQKEKPQDNAQPPKAEPPKRQTASAQSRIDFDDLMEKADNDGIRLKICTNLDIKAVSGSFFNKGLALFFSLLIFFVICVLEIAAVYLAFKTKLSISKTEAAYAAAILGIFPTAAGFAALFGYGKLSHRKSRHFTYGGALIFALNLCFFYLAFILLARVHISGADIIKKVFLPVILIMQLPVFVGVFKAITKG